MLLLLDQVRADVARHAPGSVLTLADFTGAKIDKAVATKIKEVLVLDRPYVKKSAWVGTDSLPHVFYENFKNFSQRDLSTFKTREEAMDWLVEELSSPRASGQGSVLLVLLRRSIIAGFHLSETPGDVWSAGPFRRLGPFGRRCCRRPVPTWNWDRKL